MLEFAGINLLAVLAVWVIYLAVGALWYSPAGFAKKWTEYTGIDILKIPTERATRIIVYVAIASLVQVLTLALILNSLESTTLLSGLFVGLVLWFGLVAATTVGVTLYSKRSWKFLWLNSSYFLVVMLIGSVILSLWR